MTRYGTSYFVGRMAAEQYYAEYETGSPKERRLLAAKAVARKLADSEIHIGKPPLKDGETLNVIDNGTRYEITETK